MNTLLQTAPPAPATQTAPYFGVLDGLRGIAAVAVVLFHFMEFAVPDYADNFIAHAYFAVDFFSASPASSSPAPTTRAWRQ